MSPVWRGAALVLAASLAPSLPAAAQDEAATPYLRRLALPIRGEAFRQPRAVHADLHTGEVFVCDTFGHRILIFDGDGLFRFELTGGSVFSAPRDVAVDPEGYLFVLAIHRGASGIVQLDFDGKLLGPVPLTGLPGGLPAPDLASIALSPAGDRLYALDRANQRLWVLGRGGEVLASADLASGLDPEEAEEQLLGHVDVYGDTVLVAVPTAGRIELFDLAGLRRGGIGVKGTAPCQTGFPVAAALDAEGHVLVLDKQRALFMRWRPQDNRCLREYSGFGNVPGALYRPDDLSLDAQANLYVSQGFESRVQVFGLRSAAAGLGQPAAEVAAVEPERVAPEKTSVAERAPPAAQPPRAVPPEAARTETGLPGPESPSPALLSEEPADSLQMAETAVRNWAEAWTERRVEDYLAGYAPAFHPPGDMERSAWEELRRSRLSRPEWIRVELTELEMELLQPSRVRATFTQSYHSDVFQDVVRKTLTLSLEGDTWKILEERVLATLSR